MKSSNTMAIVAIVVMVIGTASMFAAVARLSTSPVAPTRVTVRNPDGSSLSVREVCINGIVYYSTSAGGLAPKFMTGSGAYPENCKM